MAQQKIAINTIKEQKPKSDIENEIVIKNRTIGKE